MFNKWKNIALAVGGFLGWIATMLPFFGIDAKAIVGAMTTHYLFLLASVVCFGIFVYGCVTIWRSYHVTVSNVHLRIRQWLDAFGISNTPVNWPKWHFGFDVILPPTNLPTWVARTRDREQYVTLIGRLRPMTPEMKVIFDGLNFAERQVFFRDVDVELSKSKILTWRNFSRNELQIIKRIPITNRLTEFEFMELLDGIHFSAIIVWSTVARRLNEFGHAVTPPEPISDAEALPPELPPQGAKTPRQILTWIADNVKWRRYENAIQVGEGGMETIEALVRSSDDFQSEEAVEEVCRELGKSVGDPFEKFELTYGEGAFKGKRLKFLQDARVHAHITNNDDALEYIGRVWGKENGLPQRPYSPSLKVHPPNPRPLTQPSPTSDKAEAEQKAT